MHRLCTAPSLFLCERHSFVLISFPVCATQAAYIRHSLPLSSIVVFREHRLALLQWFRVLLSDHRHRKLLHLFVHSFTLMINCFLVNPILAISSFSRDDYNAHYMCIYSHTIIHLLIPSVSHPCTVKPLQFLCILFHSTISFMTSS